MAELLAVAKCLNGLHMKEHNCNMDEMKMHKMMYFSQRESLMISGTPLFDGAFEAWKYGPVLTEVRSEYMKPNLFSDEYRPLSDDETELVKSVFVRYDKFDAWQLSTLSHAESSWLKAREGLRPGEPGKRKMSLSMMSVDATKERLRRQGVVFG